MMKQIPVVLASVLALVTMMTKAKGQQVQNSFENGVNIVLDDASAPRHCLTLMGDGKTLSLESSCLMTQPNQVWYYYTDNSIGTQGGHFIKDFSDNAGAVQAYSASYNPNGENGGKFTFLSGGRIQNMQNNMCLAAGYFAQSPPTQFLKYVSCNGAPKWKLKAASIPASGTIPAVEAQQQIPQVIQQPVVQQTPQVQVQSQPVVVQQQQQQQQPVVQTSSIRSSPQVEVVQNGQPIVQQQNVYSPATPKQAILTRGRPTEQDHYLCACVISRSNDDCVAAVRAACTVGHLDRLHCEQSFQMGDHDAISREIVQIIQSGAKCSTNMEELRTEVAESSLPTKSFYGQQVVTSEDHYLCVCLSNGGDPSKLDKQCEDAVRIGCLVGHLPEPDCFASFDESNHANIVNHIMRLIDSGANCAQHLQVQRTETCPSPPCYNSKKHTKKKEPHSLCVCLADHLSVACKEEVTKACKAGLIPKSDCEVAEKADYRHAVTRHVMHLIDHGSECGLKGGKYLTFTNNRCHCKQSWKSEKTGETYSWPDNCRDPGGERGYSWCETYAEEGCVGVGDSMSWDRCDNPQKPKYHLGDFVQTSLGKVTPVDHYLCVCVDKSATDEACMAAVKASCQVGHLTNDACAESFQDSKHSRISDQILEQISHGARCNNVEIGLPTDPLNGPPVMSIASGCGHGSVRPDGSCLCANGYSGNRCDYCASGFVGYPECVPKRDCNPACHHGDCDLKTGQCVCPHNWKGETCNECASGFTGSKCTPSGLFGAGRAGWVILILLVCGATYSLCCTAFGVQLLSMVPYGRTDPSGAYSRLNQDFFDGDDNVLEIDSPRSTGMSMGEDLAGTSFAPISSTTEKKSESESESGSESLRPPQSHTGLAI